MWKFPSAWSKLQPAVTMKLIFFRDVSWNNWTYIVILNNRQISRLYKFNDITKAFRFFIFFCVQHCIIQNVREPHVYAMGAKKYYVQYETRQKCFPNVLALKQWCSLMPHWLHNVYKKICILSYAFHLWHWRISVGQQGCNLRKIKSGIYIIVL